MRPIRLAVLIASTLLAALFLAPGAILAQAQAPVSFSAPTSFAAGDSPVSVATGDFNADNDPDLAVANRFSSDVSVLLGGPRRRLHRPDQLPHRLLLQLGGGRELQRRRRPGPRPGGRQRLRRHGLGAAPRPPPAASPARPTSPPAPPTWSRWAEHERVGSRPGGRQPRTPWRPLGADRGPGRQLQRSDPHCQRHRHRRRGGRGVQPGRRSRPGRR